MLKPRAIVKQMTLPCVRVQDRIALWGEGRVIASKNAWKETTYLLCNYIEITSLFVTLSVYLDYFLCRNRHQNLLQIIRKIYE